MALLLWRAFRPDQEFSENKVDDFIGSLSMSMVRTRFPKRVDVHMFHAEHSDISMTIAAYKKLGPVYGEPPKKKPANYGRPWRGTRRK
jgi:hypothetical protein